jgi:L,D-transpeptidase YcbB
LVSNKGLYNIVFLLLIPLFTHCGSEGDNTPVPSPETPKISLKVGEVLLDAWFVQYDFDNKINDWVHRAYQLNNDNCIWYNDTILSDDSKSVITQYKKQMHAGFTPGSLDIGRLSGQIDQYRIIDTFPKAAPAVQLDVSLTYLYLSLLHFETSGLVDTLPDSLGWHIPVDSVLDSQLIAKILEPGRTTYLSDTAEPQNPQYHLLFDRLLKLDSLDMTSNWDSIPLEEKIEPGQNDDLIPEIRRRLIFWNDLDTVEYRVTDSTLYDWRMFKAVKAFQKRHLLYPDGVIGKRTIMALSTSPEYRSAQIRINLQRYKWMPDTLPDEYVWVNIPEYDVKVIQADTLVIEMNAVVGKRKSPTPVFENKIKYLVFSPYWHIPQSISGKEIIWKIRDSTTYLKKQGIDVFLNGEQVDADSINWRKVRYEDFKYKIKFRQKPGRLNPLGTVKFIFPNKYWVYLHDTNSKNYFSYSNRSRSHGCVRISKPLDFAEYLLQGQPLWDSTAIDSVRHLGNQSVVHLDREVPIYLIYFTSGVDNGRLYFYEDLYRHDSLMHALYFKD